jgi:hypothetical protein
MKKISNQTKKEMGILEQNAFFVIIYEKTTLFAKVLS